MGASTSTLSKESGRRLLAAARSGDPAELEVCAQFLQEEPLLLLYTNYQGCNVIHFAATEGHLELLRQLVALVKLHAVALSKQLALRLEQEQAKDLSMGARLSQLRQPLLPWCSRSQAMQLLDPEKVLPILLSWQNHKRVTPLMLAARAGHADCLALLLSEGADPLTVDKTTRRSCLHYAVIAGHADCVNVLLNEFRTVLQEPSPHLSISQGSAGNSSSSRPQVVLLRSAMVRDGCSGASRFVDQRTATGFSALHYACYWGCSAVAYALLTAGADVMRRTGNNSNTPTCELVACGDSTPLHLAAANGHRYVAAMLLQAQLQVMSRIPHLQAPQGSRLQAAWEGEAAWDPRAARNTLGCTAMEVANMQLNSSDLVLLLDPSVPLSWMLQAGGLRDDVRFGVPRLADLAKAALDSHLQTCLDQLETAQHEAKQQLAAKQEVAAAARQAAAIARSRSVAGSLFQLGRLHPAASPSGSDATPAARLPSSASWHAGSSMMAAAAAAASVAVPSAARRGRTRWSCWGGLDTAQADGSQARGPGAVEGAFNLLCECEPGGQEQQEPASNSEPLLRLRSWAREGEAADSDEEAARAISRTGSGNPGFGQLGLDVGGSLLQCDGSVLQVVRHAASSADGASSDVDDGDDDVMAEEESEHGEDDDTVCGICFDAESSVQLVGCNHQLCVSCVRLLITANSSSSKVPACPYCRRGMAGFVAC